MGATGTPDEETWIAATEVRRGAWLRAEEEAADRRWENRHKVDLVLAGGGVKGIAHVGAVKALADAGYTEYPRIAGTSVGAIVGGLLAIGWTPCEVWEELYTHGFSDMSDTASIQVPVPFTGRTVPLPSLGPVDQLVGLRQRRGSHVGAAATEWMEDIFRRPDADGDPRPQTFGDLLAQTTHDDPNRSPLVILATDVKLGRTVTLPRDYEELYGVDPRDQLIVSAVRASMSIPLYFEPYKIEPQYGVDAAGRPIDPPEDLHPGGDLRSSEFIDGGVLANFAVDALDDGRGMPLHPRWPTFGITLMRNQTPEPVGDNLREKTFNAWSLDDALLGSGLEEFTDSMIGTLVVGQDTAASDHWWMARRTIRIETPVGIVDFDIDDQKMVELFRNGQTAAQQFLADVFRVDGAAIGFDGRAEFPLPDPPSKTTPCRGTT